MDKLSCMAAILALLSCRGGDAVPPASVSGQAPSEPTQTGAGEVIVSVRLESESEALLFGSGRITGIFVEEGDSVFSGQSLVSLSGDAVVDGAVSAGREGVEAAGIAAANGRMDYQRCSDLYEAGAISELDLEGARTAMTAADAQYSAARAELSGAVSGRDASIVQAPFPGVIGRVWAREGCLAGSEPLVMITGGEGYLIRALLPERELGSVAPGDSAWFETGAVPGMRFSGSVTTVSPGIDPVTCLLAVTLAIEDPDGLLAPGLYGSAGIARSGVPGPD
jgi:RND family efflux transporter MFP subunit